MDYRIILQKKYPQGSIGPGWGIYRGQCASFCEALVEIPKLGSRLATKTAIVKNDGILARDLNLRFLPGDVVVTHESWFFGHCFVINFVTYIENSDQAVSFQISESNFRRPLRVDHTRVLNADSPVIVGVVRGKLLFI